MAEIVTKTDNFQFPGAGQIHTVEKPDSVKSLRGEGFEFLGSTLKNGIAAKSVRLWRAQRLF
jgi:hypothetical protein